jgi:glycosyltransferase involved in cell wall biosynthesis
MKIAFCIRPEYDKPLGGDAVQMLKTKEYLEKAYNVAIDIITHPDNITKEYDIAHIFNFSTYEISRQFIAKAKKEGLRVASSSIYWDYSYVSTTILNSIFGYPNFISERRIKLQRAMIRIMGLVLPRPVGVSSVFKRNAQWMFDNSDVVLPNSSEEGELLLNMIKREKETDKIHIVVNATTTIANNPTKEKYDEDSFCSKYGIPKNYILQVGRIEFCKNQLNLISALQDTPEIPLVFVGHPVDVKYRLKLLILSEKRGNVFFIEAVPHDEIKYFYQYANLHVLLSLRESPGLVNMEALVNNCPIVIPDSRFIPVKTYFPHQSYIVNPFDKQQIKETVLLAYQTRTLGEFEQEKFKWEVTAKQTFEAYKIILKQ